jgi:uncharacterized protein HemX
MRGVDGRLREQAERQERLSDRVAELAAAQGAARSEQADVVQSLEALRAQLAQLNDSVATLSRWRNQGSLDWTLAEVEHLLIVAAQELELSRDAAAALAALQAADLRLAAISDPAIGALRAQIAADLDALRAVPQPDRAALTARLSALIRESESLPLRPVQAAASPAAVPAGEIVYESAWRKFWRAVRAELGRLVIVTHRQHDQVLLPEEGYFVLMNLRLQLDGARLALARRDTVLFRAALADARIWLERYFDTADARVAALAAELAPLAELELDPALPGVDSSLESLRALIRAQALESPVPDPTP